MSSGLVFNVLTSLSSSKYSSHSKFTTSQIHLISPQSVPRFIKYGRAAACVDRGTARYTFNLSRGSNDGKCLLQSTVVPVCSRAVHRNWENSPPLPLSFLSVTCRLFFFFFFATIIKQVRRLKSARVTFDLNLTPLIFFPLRTLADCS